jgi:hypothetical protein
MMMIYDMNTGQIIESGHNKTRCDDSHVAEQERREDLNLQVIAASRQIHEEREMPPALASAELAGFLHKMG